MFDYIQFSKFHTHNWDNTLPRRMTVMGQKGNSCTIKRNTENLKAAREEAGQEVTAGKSEHRTSQHKCS